MDSTTTVTNGTNVNVRAVRPPPGFGVLSPDEVTGPENELPSENELEIRNAVPVPRKEEFPTLSASMRVATSNNNSGTNINYVKAAKIKKPTSTPKKTTPTSSIYSVASSSRSAVTSNPSQSPLSESTNITNKGKAPDFPPLPSANQSISASTISSSNNREKALSGVIYSEVLRYFIFSFHYNKTHLFCTNF